MYRTNSLFPLRLRVDLTFFGKLTGSWKGDGERRDSASSFGILEVRLNMPRRPCFDGELGGLGTGTGRSDGLWNTDKLGCCSKTLDITSPCEEVASGVESSWPFLLRALLSFDHILWVYKPQNWPRGESKNAGANVEVVVLGVVVDVELDEPEVELVVAVRG